MEMSQDAAEIASTEEKYESLTAGLGICLLAAGNAAIFERGGVLMGPVDAIGPARLALAWRREEDRELVRAFVAAARAVVAVDR